MVCVHTYIHTVNRIMRFRDLTIHLTVTDKLQIIYTVM